MSETYSTAQAIGIRRQADRDPRACSLARLIEEMHDDAPRLARAYFVGLWDQPDELELRLAERAFDDVAGGGEHLDPEIPRADLASLRNDAAKMTRYVDEHVAHDMAEPTTAEMPTFEEMDRALDALGEDVREVTPAARPLRGLRRGRSSPAAERLFRTC